MTHRPGETRYYDTALGIIPRSKLIPLEIEGIKRAWDFVIKKRRRGPISITPDILKKIHGVGFTWIFPDTAGRFRTINVEVSNHIPPPFYKIRELMLDFCRDLKVRLVYLPPLESTQFFEKLVALLAWAHHRFLWIHPFQDYNGRLARLLTNIILLNLDFPPIELKMETQQGRHKYIGALQAADHGLYQSLEKLIEEAFKEIQRILKK